MQEMNQQMQGQMPQEEQMPQDPMMEEDDGIDPDSDPALQSAFDFLLERLYGDEGLAESIAETLGSGGRAAPRIYASAALKLAQSADQHTNGEIAEENLAMLGMFCLNEVFEIAEAAGIPAKATDISAAFKQMIVMYMSEQGVPVEEVTKAFSQVRDEDFAQFAGNVVGAAESAPMEA